MQNCNSFILTLLHFYDLAHRCDLETQPDAHTQLLLLGCCCCSAISQKRTWDDSRDNSKRGSAHRAPRPSWVPAEGGQRGAKPSPTNLDEAQNRSSCFKRDGNRKDKAQRFVGVRSGKISYFTEQLKQPAPHDGSRSRFNGERR